tara:strand:+ start:29070 stop:30884 length:1815 start_codon:yes stop_codon:yes gene_type:complete
MPTVLPLLDVRRLGVEFRSRRSITRAVKDLSFSISAGETLALVGESGSGKSVTALALMRLIEREGGTVAGGQAMFRPTGRAPVDLLAIDESEMRALRGNEMSMIFQEPMTSLNPVLTIGDQVSEVLLVHGKVRLAEAKEKSIHLLDRVQLTDPANRFRQYPHELSGGMRQRVMIAMALACSPKLLIADEPTTALDVTIQAGILDLIRDLQKETGTAVIFITHDMGVVAEIADHIVVMRDGERMEAGETRSVFNAPKAAYTRALLESVPRIGSGAPVYAAPGLQTSDPQHPQRAPGNEPVLTVDRLVTRFAVRKGAFKRHVANIHAVDGVSLLLRRGETLGLVGESGSGKSTIGRSILKLIPITSGRIVIDGHDVSHLSPGLMRPLRKHVQMIFQDPYASLNPRLSVAELVTEPLVIHTRLSGSQRRELAAELLRRVQLPVDSLDRYPHQFSGGQRQRLCIARALSSKPKIIVADEAVSALDVSVQAQVLDLMQELQEEFGIAYLFVSHDLAVVEKVSHRVAVLDRGQIVETGPTDAILSNPQHAYTKELLAAVPIADPLQKGRVRTIKVRDRKSPMNPVGFEPVGQVFDELENGHLVAHSEGVF